MRAGVLVKENSRSGGASIDRLLLMLCGAHVDADWIIVRPRSACVMARLHRDDGGQVYCQQDMGILLKGTLSTL